MATGMDGWQVMAAPLGMVVRVGLLVTMAITASVFWDRLRRGPRGVPPHLSSSPRVTDQTVVVAYNAAVLDGWPPGELLTFIEAGRRAGTSGEHVRTVIARHWAV